jgi:hypothetical protein
MQANRVAEFSFAAGKQRENPFAEIEVDAIFEDEHGNSWKVPAFWAGDMVWKARFASPSTGKYRFRTVCTDASDSGLHGQTGVLTVEPYTGDNPLYRHGPIEIGKNRRSFAHADGTPFFFLGDDWWLGMSSRLRFPDEFRILAEDRVKKGYTAVKLTAGLNTDTTEFDERSANEGGQPWEPGYTRIRPSFFDWADRRVEMLLDLGLHPSIVGSWGFYLKSMGIETMRRHWRYCVARWGAYPVTWYLALENDLPYYLSNTAKEDTDRAQREWTVVGKYLRQVDPFHRPITMQCWSSRDSALPGLREPGILDFDSLHVGHQDRDSAARCVQAVRKLVTSEPSIPVIPGEVCFEGIGWTNWQATQRLCFWGSMLGGAGGYCYGANGIWQFNRQGDPFGNSPHGRTWGGDPWEVAMRYPGSEQIGASKKLLARYEFSEIRSHQEWIEPRPNEAGGLPPYAGGIAGKVRFFYFLNTFARNLFVRELEPDVNYRAFWFDPVGGTETQIGSVKPESDGRWNVPQLPGVWDFVLVLERT